MNDTSRAIGSANNISAFYNTLFLQHINFRAVKDQLEGERGDGWRKTEVRDGRGRKKKNEE